MILAHSRFWKVASTHSELVNENWKQNVLKNEKKTVTTTQIVLPTLDLSIKKSGIVELFAIELITIAKL